MPATPASGEEDSVSEPELGEINKVLAYPFAGFDGKDNVSRSNCLVATTS